MSVGSPAGAGLEDAAAIRAVIVAFHNNVAQKADLRLLRQDDESADVTIKIRLKQQQQQPLQQEEKHDDAQQGREEQPAAKRARTGDDGGGGAARAEGAAAGGESGGAASTGAVAAAQEGGGVIATAKAHRVLLSARSPYFAAQLMGASAAMLEGQRRCITVEMADEDGAFWVGERERVRVHVHRSRQAGVSTRPSKSKQLMTCRATHAEATCFQRLITLAYTPSYTVEEGQPWARRSSCG